MCKTNCNFIIGVILCAETHDTNGLVDPHNKVDHGTAAECDKETGTICAHADKAKPKYSGAGGAVIPAHDFANGWHSFREELYDFVALLE